MNRHLIQSSIVKKKLSQMKTKEEKKAYDKARYEKNKEEIKAHKKAYNEKNKEKIKEYREAYSQTEKGKEKIKAQQKAYQKVYFQTEKGKEVQNRSAKKSQAKFPEKHKAVQKVSNAIRDGRIIRPDQCELCGTQCKPQGHHWSYEEKNWLDVTWCCVQCHHDIHNNKIKEI